MANIRKQFNFRNGVQVDDDNFIVNPNGLVGIGTSVPTEFLDVYGTAKVTGLVTTTNLAVTGVSDFFDDVKVGSGITFNPSTGVVNATAFVGSAAGLTDIFAIAVEGWIVNAGNISTTSNVGLGNTLPNYSLQVGEDPLTGNGLSIDAGAGDVNTTGIITASSFSGVGAGITDINATSITSGTLNNSRLPQNINVSGIVTASSFSGDINATSITSGTLNNSRLSQTVSITNLDNTGIATLGIASATSLFVSGVTTSVGGFVGDVTGTASFASNLTGSPDITVSNITSANIISGVSSVGVSTVSTRLYAESIGVGTNSPSSDIHIRRSSQSRLQVTSDTAEAIVAVGRSTGLTGSNGALIFGNTAGIYPYSTEKTLDIVNYDTGNLNHYLHYGSTGVGTGNFNWLYGPDASNPLMSLTYQGNLGIGVTDPTNKLEVLGNSSFTNNVFIAGNVDISGNLTVNGDVFLDEAELNVNVIGNLTGNVYSTSGISTFFDIDAIGDIFSFRSFIGIGTQPSSEEYSFQVVESFVVSTSGVGLGTDVILPGVEVSAQDAIAVFRGVGIGTTELRSAVDFGDAGTGVPESRQIIVPRVTTTQRGLLSPQNGAIIYNTSTNQFQGFVSPSWVDLGASSGIGAVVDDTSPQLGGNLSLNGKNITGTGNINVTGSIAANQVNISGLSTFAGITTVTGPTLFAKQLNVSGVVTASQLIRSGGTSSQFLKADGSVDSSTYLTSYTETDTLDSVTSRGNTTTNDISVGIITATNGFTSGVGTAVQITTIGNQLIFTVAGVGSTSLTLY
jgi:hypothetical protein